MYNRLKNLTQLVQDVKNNLTDSSSKLQGDEEPDTLTRVTLYPAQRPRLDPWQFALIIIGVVIVTSLAIVGKYMCIFLCCFVHITF